MIYKKLVASYAKEVYGTENISSEEKRHVEKLIESEYDDSAKILLKKWDKLRDAIVERIDDISFEEILKTPISIYEGVDRGIYRNVSL